MSRMSILATLLLAILLSPSLEARDVYIVQYRANGKQALCHQALWTNRLLMFNRGATPVTVRLLGMSNGTLAPGAATSLELPPQRVFDGALGYPDTSAFDVLWVSHLDVPDGVTIEARNEVSDIEYCTPEGIFSRGVVGKVSMPVITQLTPAGVPQIILGTDLGAAGARENVMVYNGGDREATVDIQVRSACDDSVVDSRTVSVAPNTITQFGGFTTGASTICPPGFLAYNVRYTVVTADQPSFSIVSTLTESQEPSVGDVTPIVELAVALNTVF
jgi:hypothetical protein